MNVGETITVNVYFFNIGEIDYGAAITFPFVEDSLEVGPITKELPIAKPGQVIVKTFPLTALKEDCEAKITVGANAIDVFGNT